MNSQEKRLLMEQWYRQYAALIFHYACQFTDRHSAEEIVQETFCAAWEAVQRQEIEHPRAWLRKIAENVMKNHFRRSERRNSLLFSPGALPEDGRSEDPVDVELEYDGLVSRQDLHLLKRLAVDGFTYAEAARELNTTAEACRKRAARAKRQLRKLLED